MRNSPIMLVRKVRMTAQMAYLEKASAVVHSCSTTTAIPGAAGPAPKGCTPYLSGDCLATSTATTRAMKEEWRARMNPQTTMYLGEVHDPQNLQISRVFKMADVCAIPGHVGLGLNQAFYFGLPVVTEEGKHPPEIANLKHGRNGFIGPVMALTSV